MDTDSMRATLLQLRIDADLTQKNAAIALEWSASKILRIENGQSSLNVTDMKALLDLYQVRDADLAASLIEAARNNRADRYSPERNKPRRPKTFQPADPGPKPIPPESLPHFVLLRATTAYVGAIMDALVDLTAWANEGNHEAVKSGVDDLAQLVQKEGTSLKRAVRNA